MKSKTCTSSRSNKALSEYASEKEALDAAKFIRKQRSNHMVPYRCETCNKWHLAPKGRQTPSSTCGQCKDRNGKPKESYETKQGATKRARILQKEQGVSLSVYECPHGNGWHLTKKM